MKRIIFLLLLVVTITVASASEKIYEPIHPVNTYSVICFNSTTGEFGGAVQSHWFKVADVIWLEPGVGAVATQSLADFSYGALGIEMMKNGKTAEEALAGLLASDPNNAVRQVAIIDRDGLIATHTGEKCIAEAGHLSGEIDGIYYSVQANLMEKNTVWSAMQTAFEAEDGDLADRMMAALIAAQAEKGDIRGKQSAAMFVTTGKPTGMRWEDFTVDLRVDDAREPLVELHRLLNVSRAYDYMNQGDVFIANGEFDKATLAYSKASELAPGNMEILYWFAVTLVTSGQVERSLPIFKKVFEQDENWRTLIPRLVDAELLPADTATLKRIMEL